MNTPTPQPQTPSPLRTVLHRAAHTLLDTLLPNRCPLCNTRGASGFCPPCQRLLPWLVLGCPICGAPLTESTICGACQARRPHYHRVVIPFHYRAPISTQIQALKYHRRLNYTNPLSAMLARRATKLPHAHPDLPPLPPPPPPEILIPIPLHPHRLRERGFNQSHEIAKSISKHLAIPVDPAALIRIKNTPSQTTLTRKARTRNVQGAFRAPAPLPYTHIVLIDDVVTTGSTINAAALALKKASPPTTTISVWATARA